MLEEEVLVVLVTEELASLLLDCLGISLDVVPLTLERMNDHAPGVSQGAWSFKLGHSSSNELPLFLK